MSKEEDKPPPRSRRAQGEGQGEGRKPAKAEGEAAKAEPRRRRPQGRAKKPAEGRAGEGRAEKPEPKAAAKKPARPPSRRRRKKARREADAEAEAIEAEAVRKPKKVKPGSALVVVESPAKAHTINKYLGANYIVKASVGHVRDLPKSKIGVDLENGTFEPVYEVIEGKKKVVAEIRKAAREVETVYLASDPDREGEAIAWHIAEEIKDVNKNLQRVLINEITKKGVTAAIADAARRST